MRTAAAAALSLVVGALLVLLYHKPAAATAEPQKPSVSEIKCNPGPWGDLEYVSTAIELPDDYAEHILKGLGPTRWFFGNFKQDEVADFLRNAGVDLKTSDTLAKEATVKPTGTWVFPEDQFVLKLKPEVRQKIYAILSRFPENGFHQTPFIFRSDWIPQRLNTSGLPESVQQQFRELLYSRGAVSLFSDVHPMLSTLTEHDQKIRFIKMLHRKGSLLVRLAVNQKTDLKPLLKYWGVQGREWELKALLEPLTKIEGGYEVDITHLLPSFPRSKIYTYPSPARNGTQASSLPAENCHWTSFNFFADPPDDKFRDFHAVQGALDNQYDVVANKQFGDIVVLLSSSDVVLHTAVYIADDIVFTKNGGRDTQPWVLMKLEDMLPFYNALEPVKIVICRRKAA